MALSTEEREARHKKMFGCSAQDLDAILAGPMVALGGRKMLAMSILSDAQELLADDAEQNAEAVRQYINRAKMVLDMEIRQDEAAKEPRKLDFWMEQIGNVMISLTQMEAGHYLLRVRPDGGKERTAEYGRREVALAFFEAEKKDAYFKIAMDSQKGGR